MEEQRERSRSASSFEVRLTGGARSEFVGYEKTEVLTAVAALEPRDGGLFDAKLHESPFYPEGGGQVSDLGFVEDEATGARAELVRATRVGDDQVLTFEGSGFAVGDRVRAVVPWSVRFPTMANHTATHLLHAALREVLGEHVKQAGSAVRPDKLRFDFSHGQPLTPEERGRVERIVNEKIFENRPVRAFVTPIEEARKLGAMMLFGEKYGDEVRVVEVDGYSRELCGGTHVRATAEIGPFVILSEASVGAGVRRIEAVTSGEAWAYLSAQRHEVAALRSEIEVLKKATRRPAVAGGTPAVDAPDAEPELVGGVNVIVQALQGLEAEELLALSDRLKQKHAPAAVVLGSRVDGRVHLVVNVDRTLPDRGIAANELIKPVAAVVGGGGGGRPTMAQAGGRDPEKLDDAIAEARRLLTAALA
jgi:alanyl-tRNA synthetase